MADLYTVISGIQPDAQDIVEAELLAKQIIEANFPDIDLREGTGVRDLTLRPAAFLLALCKKGYDYYFSQNTLAGIDDTSPTDVVDGLLGNLFLTRNSGTYAVISARLYFARQKSVALTTSTSFSTDGSLLFFPAVSTTYPSSALQYDSYQNEYFLDVELVAGEKGSGYNISSGSLLYFSNFDPYFLHGEINYLSQESTSSESNTEFIARASTAISTRNLVNKPSIDNRLRQDFNYLNRVVTVGAGDAEMYRDQVEIRGSIHAAILGSAWAFSDSDTKVLVTLPAHGLILGQLVNITESGSGSGLLVLDHQPISDIISANQFKVLLPFTIPSRSLAAPLISAIDEDLFLHQGGNADVHCAETIKSKLNQYTLDSSGSVTIEGPVYNITQSLVSEGTLPDTVPASTAFTTTFNGYATRAGVSLSQVSGVLTLTIPAHPLSVGRFIKVSGWPASVSNLILPVTEVVDQDHVILGKNLPTYSLGSGLSPTVTYVYPKEDTGFSERQSLTVSFGSLHANQLVTLQLDYFYETAAVQPYLELSSNRVVCADFLARGFDIYVLDFDVVVYDTVAPTSGEVSTLISAFLKKLAAGQEFVLSDLVADLTANGISKLQTPVGVTYSFYSKDLFPAQTGTITDALTPYNSTSIFVLGNVVTSFTEAP